MYVLGESQFLTVQLLPIFVEIRFKESLEKPP